MEQITDQAPHSKVFFDHVRLFLPNLVFVFAGQRQDLGVLDGTSFIYFNSFACLYYLLAHMEGISRVGIGAGKFIRCLGGIFPRVLRGLHSGRVGV